VDRLANPLAALLDHLGEPRTEPSHELRICEVGVFISERWIGDLVRLAACCTDVVYPLLAQLQRDEIRAELCHFGDRDLVELMLGESRLEVILEDDLLRTHRADAKAIGADKFYALSPGASLEACVIIFVA
jgi:hypothetical protein